ncbi:hypothetical protein GCM10027200_03040 [Lentzea nigeriaca]
MREAVEHDAPGAIVAVVRRARLKQAELAAMARLWKSAITRIEAGGARRFDLRVVRVLQKLPGIPSHLLGLAEQTLMAGADSRTTAARQRRCRKAPAHGQHSGV